MNIYANNPGIDRMISELGKKIHFVNISFTDQITRLTTILLFSACLYIADAELANNLKKLTKSGKKIMHIPVN